MSIPISCPRSNRIVLPKKGLVENEGPLTTIGFIFHGEIDATLFRVSLPPGWNLSDVDPSDPCSRKIKNETRRTRGKFSLTKNAGDRYWQGECHWCKRFTIELITTDGRPRSSLKFIETVLAVAVVMDGDKEIFRTDPLQVFFNDSDGWYDLSQLASEWLLKNRPNADDPFESWNY